MDDLDVVEVANAVEVAAGNSASTLNGKRSSSTGLTTSNRNHDIEKGRLERPPQPLPRGWITKESRSNPEYYYYYNMDTGMSIWDSPVETMSNAEQVADQLLGAVKASGGGGGDDDDDVNGNVSNSDIRHKRLPKRQRTERTRRDKNNSVSRNYTSDVSSSESSAPSSSGPPKEVRVLHILKKHAGSRRPASWRNPKITSTKEEAHEELIGLLEILREEEIDVKALRATFEELARTESDCSSAKRGGDLGFFGRKKMQLEFEREAFRLKKGELTTNIIDTKSGSHILLRIG